MNAATNNQQTNSPNTPNNMAWTVKTIKPGTAYANYTCKVTRVAKFKATTTVDISADRKTYSMIYVNDASAAAGTDTWTLPIVYIPGPPSRGPIVVQAIVVTTIKGTETVPTIEDGTPGGRVHAKRSAKRKA